MAHNESITQLDPRQALLRTYDCDHDAVRITYAHDHEMSIELNAEDGDSVAAVPQQVVVTNTTPVSCVRVKTACLYVKNGSAELQVSPADSGDVWVTVATVPTTATVDKSSVTAICARRMRVVPADGTEAVYVVGQS